MKKQKVMLLVLLVALIWGTIGFKIASGLTSGNSDAFARIEAVTVSDSDINTEYSFVLDYQDPFLKNQTQPVTAKKSVSAKPPVQSGRQQKASGIVVDWGKMEYTGSIYNASRNKLIATIHIAGKEYFVREGEEVQGFLVEIIHRDSIKVGYGTQKKYIKQKK